MRISIIRCLFYIYSPFHCILLILTKLLYPLRYVVILRHDKWKGLLQGTIIGFILGVAIIGTAKLSAWNTRQKMLLPKYGGKFDNLRNRSVADFLYMNVTVLCWTFVGTYYDYIVASQMMGTWGKRCNKFLLFSSLEGYAPNSIRISAVNKGVFELSATCIKYIKEYNLIDEADWFMNADVGMYVIMENLRYVLFGYNPDKKIHFTLNYNHIESEFLKKFGYVLSRAGLEHFYELHKQNTSLINLLWWREPLKTHFDIESDIKRSSRIKDLYQPNPKYKGLDGSEILCINAYSFSAKQYDYACSYNYLSFHSCGSADIKLLELFMYSLDPYGISYSYPLPEKNVHDFSSEFFNETLSLNVIK